MKSAYWDGNSQINSLRYSPQTFLVQVSPDIQKKKDLPMQTFMSQNGAQQSSSTLESR